MTNPSIYAAFERMWQHIVLALGGKASTDVATTENNGLMSLEDKAKLDGIEEEATRNTITLNTFVMSDFFTTLDTAKLDEKALV